MTRSIFFNGRFLSQPLTGVQRYAVEVFKALDALVESGPIDTGGCSLVILTPPEPCSPLPLKHIEVHTVGRLKGNLWEQIDLPWHARRGLLFSPCNIGPLLHFNQVVTIHDASVYAVPEAYSTLFRLKYKIIFQILGKTARHVFTDSEFSRKELAAYCGISPERVQVVPLGHEHILNVPADAGVFKKYDIGQKPYVLAVSSNSPHKNLVGLVKAVEGLGQTDFEVVMVGGTFSKVFQKTEIKLPEMVKRIGYANDSELRALYEQAVCFVYPSTYEGFGLPPLEAMTLGCPVVVSKAASLPEVCGDAVVYCDPHDPADIREKMLLTLRDQKMRLDLRARGYETSRRFSWASTALALWRVLKNNGCM